MRASDWIGTVAFAAFGAWWLLVPRSVLRFYSWLHSGRFGIPREWGVRIAGALWILLVLFVASRASAR